MKYICKICKYETPRKSSLESHLMTEKHQKTVRSLSIAAKPQRIIQCEFCNYIFTQVCHLNRHVKSCYKRNIVIQNYEQQLHEAQLNNEKLEIKNKLMENELKFAKEIALSTNSIAKVTTNSLNYIVKNYNDAPDLTKINDYSILFKNDESNGNGSIKTT
jgi:hypothetical protein